MNLLGQSTATVFDSLLAVCSGEDDNGVELGVIQLVHCIGSNVEQSMATPAIEMGITHDVGIRSDPWVIHSLCCIPPVHDIPDGRESNNATL